MSGDGGRGSAADVYGVVDEVRDPDPEILDVGDLEGDDHDEELSFSNWRRAAVTLHEEVL